jgi:methionyl-tRNA formyltransferase
MNDKGIIFMGTPEFAVATLNALVEAGMDVRAVVTAPDRPAGRGRKLRSSAVKQRADELGLKVLQPERLKAPEFQAQLEELNAALYVVVAFRMLPEVVWSRPRFGTVNLHASLLPQYRGAAPINWAVANGEERSGVTTFLIQQAIDTGDILLQEEVTVGADENAGDLHDRLMNVGANLMVRTVQGLFDDTIQPTPQPEDDQEAIRVAPKLDPENTRLDPSSPARHVHDLIRGMSPYPGAWCEWHEPGKVPLHCKVFRSRIERAAAVGTPGTLRIEGPRLYLACADNWLEILELQIEGRKRMAAADLLRGLQRTEGSIMK